MIARAALADLLEAAWNSIAAATKRAVTRVLDDEDTGSCKICGAPAGPSGFCDECFVDTISAP
jgi:hypothetical protein